jgi:hypothetical protein
VNDGVALYHYLVFHACLLLKNSGIAYGKGTVYFKRTVYLKFAIGAVVPTPTFPVEFKAF